MRLVDRMWALELLNAARTFVVKSLPRAQYDSSGFRRSSLSAQSATCYGCVRRLRVLHSARIASDPFSAYLWFIGGLSIVS